MFHIAGREISRARVKAGLANAKRHGKKLGRSRAMVNLLAVDEMASRGLSGRAIAKTVGVSEATARRILRGSRVNATKTAARRAPVAVPCV
jgi:DNA invertase Pin-like site-specific DNA recombinase